MDTYFKESLEAALKQRGWFMGMGGTWFLPFFCPPAEAADALPNWKEMDCGGCVVNSISDAVRVELYREAHK